ncbi:halocyanin domain-containing protein [Halobacteriales archaeon Cl-PHB]
MDRRTLLAVTGGSLGLFAGCLGIGGGGGDGATSYGDWFDNVDNYEGEVDRTGQDQVSVAVGAGDGFAFAPAAIRVDSGTTVRWEWTGDGGRHNVVERDEAFSSPYHQTASATFDHEFTDSGLYPYVCEPHEQLGMKGGVRVV